MSTRAERKRRKEDSGRPDAQPEEGNERRGGPETGPGAEDDEEVEAEDGDRAGDAEEDELGRLARERAEYLASWKRARADYQNLRRRVREDIERAVTGAREGLLSELLLVLDTLELALATECSSHDGKNLLLGVGMTRDQLLQMLEREGVCAVPDGGTFDPALHQAVETVVDPEREPGEIVATVRRGYRKHDGVLRFAQVKVCAAAADVERAAGEEPDGEPPADPRPESEPESESARE